MTAAGNGTLQGSHPFAARPAAETDTGIATTVASARGAKQCAHCGLQRAKLLKCTGCGQARYCSIEHQKLHWKQGHKQECSEIRNTGLNPSPTDGSAASNGVDSQLLEACVACEIVFADAGAVARALARLVHHLGDDGDALGSLVDTLKLVRSVASEMREKDARGAANGRAEGIPGIPTDDDQVDGREPPRVAAVLAALFMDGDAAVG